MNIQQINSEIAITDFLASQGIQPAHQKGCDWWYISPIRPAERTPSFKVSTRLNRWYDHGAGEGGKVFDLAMRIYQTGTVRETIQLLSERFSLSQASPILLQTLPEKQTAQVPQAVPLVAFPPGLSPGPSPRIILLDAQPLSPGSELATYLRGRGIRHATANAYCEEVSYSIGEKSYKAVGFRNSSGGYELRNAWFKGSSSPKDVTFLDQGAKSVCVLEGFVDFLSLLQLRPHLRPNSNFLILNSVALAGRSLALLREHREVYLFLDRDGAGRRLTEKLASASVAGIDASSFYQGHKDVNELLMSKVAQRKRHRLKSGLS